MRKFKLIKEYPGSEKMGYITENIVNKDIIKTRYSFTEFWEEIIEKDYEILSLEYDGNIYVLTKEKTDDNEFKYNFMGGFCLLSNLVTYPRDVFIHSVKRLSDGEIFTVGDEADVKTFYGTRPHPDTKIEKFAIENNSFYVIINIGGHIQAMSRKLKDIEKIKQPKFITEDGVKIFEGDFCYYIDQYTTSIDVDISYNNIWNGDGSGCKYFSTKQAAEAYIGKHHKIKIGGYEVEFKEYSISINGHSYGRQDLLDLRRLMKSHSIQIKSLNVGCQGQYKIDIELLDQIVDKL